MSFLKQLSIWWPVIFWCGVIFSLSSITNTGGKTNIPDYIFHFTEYFILAIFVYRSINISFPKQSFANRSIITLLFCTLYAFSDEFHQLFVPGRDASIRDVIFDIIGALSAILIIWKLLPLMPMQLRNLAKKLQLI